MTIGGQKRLYQNRRKVQRVLLSLDIFDISFLISTMIEIILGTT